MNSTKRDITFDVVRALCIIEIVCFWHATNYINSGFISESSMTIFSYVTTSILGTFTFMSGFFLKKYQINSFTDVRSFLIIRFKRFWLLYFISSFTLYAASLYAGQPWYPTLSNFILSLFGLTCFFQPLPPTLWFMVMMMLFYLITPFLLWFTRKKDRMIASTLFFILLLVLHSNGFADERLLCYYPMYVLGLLLNPSLVETIKQNPILSIAVSSVLLMAVVFLLRESWLFSLLICITGLPIIIGLSKLITKSQTVSRFAGYISYSSLCMYLFHRHFFLGFLVFYHAGSLTNIREAVFPIWFVYVVVCPVIIVSCYLIQRLYDRMIKRV